LGTIISCLGLTEFYLLGDDEDGLGDGDGDEDGDAGGVVGVGVAAT
jgi:hypothetical protein